MTLSDLFSLKDHLFPFNNLVFDTTRCALRPIQSRDHICFTAGYSLGDATDEAKRDVLSYLWSLFEDHAVVDYFLDLLATVLCGKRASRVIVLFRGSGGNGKTMLSHFLYNAFRSFAAPLMPGHVARLNRRGSCTGRDIPYLRDKRLLYCPELLHDTKLSQGLIKFFTEQDPIFVHSARNEERFVS
jgi:hypothetical protein